MIKNWSWLVGVMILIGVIAGCSTPNPPVSPGITVIAPSPTVEENGYPAPATSSAYPAPDGNQQLPPVTKVVPTVIPQTPDPDLAVVKGRLLLNDQPVEGAILYLAKVIYGESGTKMVRFERTTSIRSETDEDGDFTFINVLPGEYGLVLDRIIDSLLLLTPEGETLLLNVISNEQIDLGALNYEELPIDQ